MHLSKPRRKSTTLSHAGIKIAASHLHADYVSARLYPRPRRHARCREGKPAMRWQRHRRSADKAAFLHVLYQIARRSSANLHLLNFTRDETLAASFALYFNRSVCTGSIRSQILKCPLTSVEIARIHPRARAINFASTLSTLLFFFSFLSDASVSSEHFGFPSLASKSRRSAERRICCSCCSPNSGSDLRAVYSRWVHARATLLYVHSARRSARH